MSQSVRHKSSVGHCQKYQAARRALTHSHSSAEVLHFATRAQENLAFVAVHYDSSNTSRYLVFSKQLFTAKISICHRSRHLSQDRTKESRLFRVPPRSAIIGMEVVSSIWQII